MALLFAACADAGSATDVSTSTGSDSTTESGSTTEPGATTESGSTTGSDSTGAPGEGEWVGLAPLPGGPRQETAVVAVGGRVFVLGGFAGAQVTDRVEAYDPATDTWTSAAALPVPMHHANAAVVADTVVVAGFLTGIGFTAEGSVLSFDPATDAWSEHDAMPTGTERGGSGTATLDGLVYVVGGLREGQAVADAWSYERSTDVWLPLPDLPTARDHLVAVAADGKIFAIGGRDASIASHVDRVDVYDPVTDSWSAGPPMPTSRAGMAAAAVGSSIFVSGGEGNPDDPSGVFGQHEALDVLGGWTALPPMPTPRHGTGAAALDGVVYVPGGATTEGFGPTDVFEAWVVG